jgi:SPP1 gp7 family putative phage head morphogenesis protein
VPDLYDLANEQRDAVLSRDRTASAELVRAYAPVAKAVRQEMDDVLRKIAQAQATGQVIRPSWLDSKLRLSSILSQLEKQMQEYSNIARGIVASDINDAINLGHDDLIELLRQQTAGIVSFRNLNEAALQSIAHTTNKGALRDLLRSFGPELSERLRGLLLTAITTGRSPEVTARMIRDATGVPLTRAITIARTESMRGYREAQHRSMQENSDVLEGWYWLAKLARNTCAACWAMHGTKHRVSERLNGHPRCRCSMMPFTKTWADLGFAGVPESRPDPPTPGTDRFENLKDSSKLQILGPGRYRAYVAGTPISDMAYTRQSKTWGPSIAVVPVVKLEG